jgi:hypothetical protein
MKRPPLLKSFSLYSKQKSKKQNQFSAMNQADLIEKLQEVRKYNKV